MKNFIFISPNFPQIYSHFVKQLNENGVRVLGIGDEPFERLNDELKTYLTEYCYVSDMNRFDWMINTVQYLKDKYGDIDFIESNNEYWMRNDAKLREWFNIKGGYRFNDLEKYQAKSSMKKYFKEAGVKTARYMIASNVEETLEFVKTVGYPIFAKPDSGVGACGTYKINNEADIINFYNNKPQNERYIIEEYIDGYIVSFDGIANSKSEVVICFKETFPIPIAELVNKNLDTYYYAESKMDDSYKQMGKKIVKAFNIESRPFHIELWVLNKDKPGLAKKGEIIALEANLRSPGGNTPDLLNLVSSVDYYNSYAKMIAFDIGELDNSTNLRSYSINRKNDSNYVHSSEEIMNKYISNLKCHGYYPEAFRAAMGDEFFFFTFDKNENGSDFLDFVLSKNNL